VRRLVRWREWRRRQRKRRRRRRWHRTAAAGTPIWPRRDAPARSTSSPPSAATAGTWRAPGQAGGEGSNTVHLGWGDDLL
jgi:hypothetical protein